MKSGSRGWGRAGVLAAVFLFTASCGGGGSSDADLSSGGGGGTDVSGTASSPSEMGVGDIMAIALDGSASVEVDFDGVDGGAKFILAVGSANAGGASTSVRISANEALPAGDPLAKSMQVEGPAYEEFEEDGYGPQEILSAWLRASEEELTMTEAPLASHEVASSSRSAGFKAVGVSKAVSLIAEGDGGREDFYVLSSLSSTSSFKTVTGELRCAGRNVDFYVDVDPAGLMSDDQIETLCVEFDEMAGEEQELLGSISDVDGNGKLDVLMTEEINRLGAMGGGIITGYFYANDLMSASHSNRREIIYTMVPDPTGRYGATISTDFAMSNLLPAVLPHELQHAISYNHKVIQGGGLPEESWLNEAMSHLIEDRMGYKVENPSRYAMFLASPSTYGVVTSSSPNLMERGASYLFLRFLYEQASDGDAFLRALIQSGQKGVENLEAAFDGPDGFNEFSHFMKRWVLALAMTDRGITQDERYTYRARVRGANGNWQGVCLDCNADDNRGTVLSGVNLNPYYGTHNPTIDASAAMFFSMTPPPQMRVTGTSGGGNFAYLIRTQ